MLKKKIYQLISVCLLLGTLAACSSEDELGKSFPTIGIRLEMKTTGQTRASVELGTEAERQINSVSVWFFKEGAADTEKAMFHTKVPSSSSTGNIILNFSDEELRLHNMTSEGSYEVFVIANLPADASIDGETTLSDLKGYSYIATSRPESPFCMTANSVGAHDFGKNSTISIPLLRVASRLDITLKNATGKKWIINKISIDGDPKSVMLFAPVNGAAVPASGAFGTAQDIMTTPTTSNEATCSGYIYENRSANAVKVLIEGSVDGTARTWTAELKPEGVTTLPRNTICGVTLNLKEGEPIVPTDVGLSLKGWDNEVMITKLPATYLELNKNSLEVEYVLGGVLGVKSDAETILVDWSDATGFYLSGHENETEAVVTLTDENADLIFNFLGNSDVVIPDGTILITAGNLSRKIPVRKIKNNIIFKLKPISINGHTISDGDTIPADYWGSTNSYELIVLGAATNITWAFSLNGYLPSIDFKFVEMNSYSTYNGISGGDSELVNPDTFLMPNLKVEGWAEYLPANVTIDFYLNSFEVSDMPFKLQTIHFTIDN